MIAPAALGVSREGGVTGGPSVRLSQPHNFTPSTKRRRPPWQEDRRPSPSSASQVITGDTMSVQPLAATASPYQHDTPGASA